MPAPENVKWVFSNGRWVAVSQAGPQSQPAADDKTTASAPSDKTAAADPFGFRSIDKSDVSRIIAIDLKALQQGNQMKDIVIRNNDIIQITPLEAGEFYVMGEVQRPGVYSIQGRKITAKMAIAAAGNFGPLSYPPNSILIRRIGKNQEQIFPLNMEKIFRGEENDVFLKPDDVLAVGQNVLSPFLIVLRNAFRLTYGFGFIYDRNFADALVPSTGYNSKRFTNW
ncbi:MAG: hypothetical protein EHM48_00625 [Planctomycetaceae bacterium]|nr:MAG: hypothetical protein EHM48_00625 [Planctomycetaceae bacterium]